MSTPSRLVLCLPQSDSCGDVEIPSLVELSYERQLMTFEVLRLYDMARNSVGRLCL